MLVTGNIALVSYISGPLAKFLDSLRLELTPHSRPRAHVTILPPRPVAQHLDSTLAGILEDERGDYPFVEIELGDVNVFPCSNVIYIDLRRGADALCALHRQFNRGILSHQTPYSYHPHLTLAQGLSPSDAQRTLPDARQIWNDYRGHRNFVLENLSLVRQSNIDSWYDIANLRFQEVTASAAKNGYRTSIR